MEILHRLFGCGLNPQSKFYSFHCVNKCKILKFLCIVLWQGKQPYTMESPNNGPKFKYLLSVPLIPKWQSQCQLSVYVRIFSVLCSDLLIPIGTWISVLNVDVTFSSLFHTQRRNPKMRRFLCSLDRIHCSHGYKVQSAKCKHCNVIWLITWVNCNFPFLWVAAAVCYDNMKGDSSSLGWRMGFLLVWKYSFIPHTKKSMLFVFKGVVTSVWFLCFITVKEWSYPRNRPWRLWGIMLCVKDPTLFGQ
jgi:hypothetical protein